MLFQLTNAGKALLDANPTGTLVTRADFGSGYGYVPVTNPTGLQGSVVFTTTMSVQPSIASANVLRYTILVAGDSPSFTSGEFALYAGSTLFGVGAQASTFTKSQGDPENVYRLDVFVDITTVNNNAHFASFELVSSSKQNFFPRVQSVEQLVSPAFDENNVYNVYGTGPGNAFLAFSDPTGLWSFSSKSTTWFSGTISSVGSQGLQSADLIGASYEGNLNDLVLQFTTGSKRGFCRQVTELTTGGALVWFSPMLDLPSVGDSFIIVGPSTAVAFTGTHNSLGGIQGGTTGQYYHLTQPQYANVQYPRVKLKNLTTSSYTLLPTDLDTYCTSTVSSVTLTIPANLDQGLYPIGGATVIQVTEGKTLVVSAANTVTLIPSSSVSALVPSGQTLNVALIRKDVNSWDYVSSMSGSSSSGDTNTINNTFSTRANPDFLPVYSSSSSPTGPVATVIGSRLRSDSSNGGLAVYPKSMTSAVDWKSSILFNFNYDRNTIGTTPTGLPNTATNIAFTVNIGGTNYGLSIPGSSAQTFGALVNSLNTKAASVVPNTYTVTFVLSRAKVLLRVDSSAQFAASVPTSTVLTSSAGFQSNGPLSFTSVTSAVSTGSIHLDLIDSVGMFVRQTDTDGVNLGYKSSVIGKSGVAIGSVQTIIGDYSSVLGSDGSSIVGNLSSVIGGAWNFVGPSNLTTTEIPESVVILGGTGNRILSSGTDSTRQTAFLANKNTSATKAIRSLVAASEATDVQNYKNVVISSMTVSLNGNDSVVVNSENITLGASASKIVCLGLPGLTTDGDLEAVVVFPNTSAPTVSNSSSLTYPRANYASGSGLNQTLSFAGYGNSAQVLLSSDGRAPSVVNGIKVVNPTILSGVFVAKSTDGVSYKAWRVSALFYADAGNSNLPTAAYGMTVEVVGYSASAVNWTFGWNVQSPRVYPMVVPTNANSSGRDTIAISGRLDISWVNV